MIILHGTEWPINLNLYLGILCGRKINLFPEYFGVSDTASLKLTFLLVLIPLTHMRFHSFHLNESSLCPFICPSFHPRGSSSAKVIHTTVLMTEFQWLACTVLASLRITGLLKRSQKEGGKEFLMEKF